jgi:hypothetical protein
MLAPKNILFLIFIIRMTFGFKHTPRLAERRDGVEEDNEMEI